MKKSMIKEGALDKYGRPNEKTPPDWEKKLFSDDAKPPAAQPQVRRIMHDFTIVQLYWAELSLRLYE